MIINGALFVFVGVLYAAYRLACVLGEPARERTTNHEVGSHDA